MRIAPELRRLFRVQAGTHTEYAGPGRVRFLSFFGGAGYCVPILVGRGWDGRPLDEPGFRPNLRVRGFTVYVRTAASGVRPSWGGPVRRFRVSTNPNRPVV
jgi:hypothetical protein